MEFRVIWEILVHADDPQHAAEQARAWQLNPETPATVFGVWEYDKLQMHRVDLTATTDQLDGVMQASLRSTLRKLQCATDPKPGVKDLAAAMLIFLDDANVVAGRHQAPPAHL
jgi:hypothetical protein